MTPISALLCLHLILLFKLKDISGTEDYWSDNFDESKNCENEGRRQISATVAHVPAIKCLKPFESYSVSHDFVSNMNIRMMLKNIGNDNERFRRFKQYKIE